MRDQLTSSPEFVNVPALRREVLALYLGIAQWLNRVKEDRKQPRARRRAARVMEFFYTKEARSLMAGFRAKSDRELVPTPVNDVLDDGWFMAREAFRADCLERLEKGMGRSVRHGTPVLRALRREAAALDRARRRMQRELQKLEGDR